MIVDLNDLIQLEDDRTYEEDDFHKTDFIKRHKPYPIVTSDFDASIPLRNSEIPILFIAYTTNA
jgi:hypothetical protein